MKLVYLIHSLNLKGGMERVLTLKANYLAERLGYDVTIVTARMKGRPYGFPLSPAVKHMDLDANDRFGTQRRLYRRRLDACLKELRPDITISLAGNDIYALPRCTDGSVKMAEFHFSHDKFLLKYGSSPLGRTYARLRTRKLEKAASAMRVFVTLTKEDQAVWSKLLPNVRQIYNPLTFNPESGAKLEGKRCIAAGRLVAQKNFRDAIDAWKTVAERYPDWRLDIFGEGSQRDALTARIKENGLEGKVRLCGNSSKLQDELLSSDFLIMSSKFEGFPMILLEAAACGLPIVSYDCPCGPSEIVQDGVNGYLAPAGDVKGLADAACRMIEAPRKDFGTALRGQSGQFGIDVIMQQWDALFKSLK